MRKLKIRDVLFLVLSIENIVTILILIAILINSWQTHEGLFSQIPERNNEEVIVDTIFANGENEQLSLQGYVAQGGQEFLDTYNSKVAEEQRQFARLRAEVADDKDLTVKADAMQKALEEWRSSIAVPSIEAVQAGRLEQVTVNTPQESALFNKFRVANESLANEIDRYQAQIASDSKTAGRTLIFLVLLLETVSVPFSIITVWLIVRKRIVGPLGRIGAEVKRITAGDLERTIDVKGPREVEQLSGDVEQMRKRIVSDLEETEAARSQLNLQAVELSRSNADLEEFAYVVSHDLQAPLRQVISFCELIEQRYSKNLDETAYQYISFTVDSATRMQKLIHDLLAVARVARSVESRIVDLNDAANEAVDLLEAQIRDANASIELASLPQVVGDPALLSSLFGNLINNGIKFRSKERRPIIQISAVRKGKYWEIAVADNGIGIDKQYAEKIFVIFQRLHARDEYEGSGVGLSLCRKIIEFHGGHIWLDTEVTQGATIRFTLPAIGGEGGRGF